MRLSERTPSRTSAPVVAVGITTVVGLGLLAGCGSGDTGAPTESGSPSAGLAQEGGSAAPSATATVTDTTTAGATNTAADTTTVTRTNSAANTTTATTPTATTTGALTSAAPSMAVPTQHEKLSGDGDATATAQARLVDLRVGKHATFDRIVLDFDAAHGLPSWQVDYVEPPFHHLGSGKPVKDMGGQVFLRIDLARVSPPADAVPDRLHPELPAIYDVVNLGTFEGRSAVGIGVQSRHGAPEQEPFRAFRDQHSLVIDVAHP